MRLLRIPRIHTYSWEFISQSWECKRLPCMLVAAALIPRKHTHSWESSSKSREYVRPSLHAGIPHSDSRNCCTILGIHAPHDAFGCMLVRTIPGNTTPFLGIPSKFLGILASHCTLHSRYCVPGIAFPVVIFPGITVTVLGIRSQH